MIRPRPGLPGRPRLPARRWLAPAWRACLLAAAVVSAAGCIAMPDSGGVGQAAATQSAAAQNQDYVGAFPRDPQPGWSPEEVVAGFLQASASPTNSAIAQEYLADPGRTWDPGWSVTVFSQFSKPRQSVRRAAGHGSGQAEVTIGGTVQATFDGTGQYVAAQSRPQSVASYPFRLTQVGGQWRIVNPPPYRMVTADDFPQVYQPLDLYFFGTQSDELVPDPVFVPDSTPPALLVGNLVRALTEGPQTSWLRQGTSTEFPAGTSILGVSLDGATAVVNLGRAVAGVGQARLTQIAAQLAWTLGGVSLGTPAGGPAIQPAIQSVELEIDGRAVIPSPCGGPSPSPVQKKSAYDCYNPYLSTSPGFYFVAGGQPWSRCALESEAVAGQIGRVMAVFGRSAGPPAPSAAQCAGQAYVSHDSAAFPPAQPAVRGMPLTMATMSPDGRYLAGVSGDTVYVYAMAGGTVKATKLASPISAISWDRDDDLWIAQQGTVLMMPATGSPTTAEFTGANTGAYVSSLSVAPDGVRIGLIVGRGPRRQLELAAITSPVPASAQRGTGPAVSQIGPTIRLAPSLTDPDALTWYDADQLVVLSHAGTGSSLWQVPVDGEQPTELAGTPAAIMSITADGAGAALVAGLPGGRLDVSAGLEGPWQPLGAGGVDPAYPG